MPPDTPRTLFLTTTDGVRLEAELAPASGSPRAGVVLCHPHPRYGGSMRSLVVSELFANLPPAGVTCLRFNFRGVGSSGGRFDAGPGERRDTEAALDALRAELAEAPLVLAGWSFGADVALSIVDPSVAAWIALAPPGRWTDMDTRLAHDRRPKLVLFGEHDELVDVQGGAARARAWTASEVDIVPGTDHFFVGRTDRVVERTLTFLGRLTDQPPTSEGTARRDPGAGRR